MTGVLQSLDGVLRSPSRTAQSCTESDSLSDLVKVSLGAIVLGAAVFGGVLATPRGGLQIVYSSVKLPLAVLVTLVVTVPAFHVLSAALGRAFSFRSSVALCLAASARAALVLTALAPLVWFALDAGVPYHQGILLAVASYAVSGITAFTVLVAAVGRNARGLLILACCCAVVAPAGGQTAWMLRPYLGRPAQTRVPLLRARESSFVDAVFVTGGSVSRRESVSATPRPDETQNGPLAE